MTETTTTTVLIVGAGPTGLTLACQLARRGVPFEIIEASEGPQAGSRGKGLQPRSLEIFEDLGIVKKVLAHAQVMPMDAIAPDGSSRRVGEVPDSLLNRPDVPYPASVITPEWRVEESLRTLLGELGGSVRFGSWLDSFVESGQEVVATVTRGGAQESIRARWLVGSDGGHSVVRKQSGISFVGETRDDVRMLVADVAVEGLDRDSWHMWRSDDDMASLCPLPSTDLFQFQAGLAPGVEPDLGLASLQTVLERVSGRSDVHLVDAPWASVWRANIRLADRYRVGSVFLAGDAAHIHSPAGGQGMNTGIQDATNLAWKLAAVVGGADESLLETYDAERRPVAEHVLAMSNERLASMIRDRVMPTRRDISTIQLDIGYRDSALARDDRDGRNDSSTLRAGDRAPDATGLTTRDGLTHRLFELTAGGSWSLLNFGAAPLPAIEGVRLIDAQDSDGSLAAAYAPTQTTLVLIRPDGYIAVISDAGDLGAVTAYLRDFDLTPSSPSRG
ncbi:3-(3-hydroxyphenyl)propionate hydroxylase [Frondihabitans sp. PAMC 28766]|uniref:FAD-dependent monooxygenase n=1 Tax=Frondihabitans sp. PAMC 28766 TaxID=1795630 RepID=UPI00078C50E9|nr:FAD-dependent monooxygenase [Frondihabitans sp. PAMC 28766]AMM19364.1 3-(3-hydroxyphenyl)propionate hydroxylase [Frondihabitans sp. PAMC 28766]